MKKVYLLIAGFAAVILGLFPTPAGAGPTTSTTVIHGATFTGFFADDICGPRASTVTFNWRTQVTHVTEHPDGTFTFQYLNTGTYHVNFVDPTIADQNSQFTESTHISLTPGGTQIVSYQFHDFPTGIRISQHLHLTVVDGNPVVDRDVGKVTGCP